MALHVVDHPLIQHKLTIMRDKKTGPKDFRELLNEITALMLFEVTKDLPLEDIEIETPMEKMTGKVLDGKKLCIVPILRAGLGMVEPCLSIMPTAKVGYLGMYRNEETFEPVDYYSNIPPKISERIIIVLDPMLATGGSGVAAVKFLKERQAEKIKFLALVAAPEGIKTMEEAVPDVDIYVASLDRELNEKAYIMPGLGDAGDRLNGSF